MKKADTKRLTKLSATEGMNKAFEALRELPDSKAYRPEGCFSRSDLQEEKFDGSRQRAETAIRRLLRAGKIKEHQDRGVGNAKFYYFVG